MRVTNASTAQRLIQNMQTAQSQLTTSQERLSTGLKINRPSDDPVGTSGVMADQAVLDRITHQQTSITLAQGELDQTDAILGSVGSLLNTAQQLSIQGTSGSIGPSTRSQLATQVSQLITQMVSLGNTTYNGRHIFAGQQTQTVPFAENTPGAPTAVTYAGDAGQVQREIADGQQIPVNVNGGQLFAPIFQKLIALRDALQSNNVAVVSTASAGISAEVDNVLAARTQVGALTQRVTLAQTELTNSTQQVQVHMSGLQDADMAQEAVNLQTRETAYQAALAATGRSLNESLLNFLQ